VSDSATSRIIVVPERVSTNTCISRGSTRWASEGQGKVSMRPRSFKLFSFFAITPGPVPSIALVRIVHSIHNTDQKFQDLLTQIRTIARLKSVNSARRSQRDKLG